MEVEKKVELKENLSRYVFLFGGNDLEMEQIRKRLEQAHANFIDKGLQWGAKVTDYRDDILEISKSGKIPVLIELSENPEAYGDEFFVPANAIVIDHHGENAQRDSSIIQVLKLLQLEITQEDWMIGLNDSSGIYGLIDSGKFTRDEIIAFRRRAYVAQGLDSEIMRQSEACEPIIDENLSLAVVYLPHTKFGQSKDALVLNHNIRLVISVGPDEGGKHEVEFQGFDNGMMGKKISEKLGASSWAGGIGYGQEKGPYFVGGYIDNPNDFVDFVKNLLREANRG